MKTAAGFGNERLNKLLSVQEHILLKARDYTNDVTTVPSMELVSLETRAYIMNAYINGFCEGAKQNVKEIPG